MPPEPSAAARVSGDSSPTAGRRGALRALVAALLVATGAGAARGAPPDRIVLIVIDTLRRDQLALYGGPALTPNLERLARHGTLVPSARAAFHQTSMSMGALFSGRTPSLSSGDASKPLDWTGSNWCGLARFAPAYEHECIPKEIETLGEAMHARGYWTIGVTANILTYGVAGFRRGFDDWTELKTADPAGPLQMLAHGLERGAALRSGEAVDSALKAALDRRPGDHFFLYAHYMDVHDWHLRHRSYTEAVEIADRFVGELLDGLQAADLLDGTAFVVVGDHGEALGESHVLPATPRHVGNPSFQSVLQIPLIVSGVTLDGELDGPIRSDGIGRLLRRLGGAPALPPPVLEPDELLLTELEWQTYRRGRWKTFWKRSDGSVTLVDLVADPGEQHDVASQHPGVLEAHRRRIAELVASLADRDTSRAPITDEDAQRLRVLGYAE